MFWDKENILRIDFESKHLIVRRLPNICANAQVVIFWNIFSEFGLQFHIHSDGGTNSATEIFLQMFQEFGIVHTTSNPHHHQDSGLSKLHVNFSKRHTIVGTDISTALMSYHTTPVPGSLPSPVELFMNRKQRITLPSVLSSLLEYSRDHVREEFQKKREH